jgi:predicted unusual protein kinase regulating ubiquinone biosynthesis (AarF/ABC1/UbiB family)
MYVENVVTVMKRELLDECDYIREAECNQKFSQLLKDGKVCLSLFQNLKIITIFQQKNKIR